MASDTTVKLSICSCDVDENKLERNRRVTRGCADHENEQLKRYSATAGRATHLLYSNSICRTILVACLIWILNEFQIRIPSMLQQLLFLGGELALCIPIGKSSNLVERFAANFQRSPARKPCLRPAGISTATGLPGWPPTKQAKPGKYFILFDSSSDGVTESNDACVA